MTESRTIVVLGATGIQGNAVVQALRSQAEFKIVATSRDPNSAASQKLRTSGIEVRKADLEDVASLTAAFAGAYGVFGVTNPFLAKGFTFSGLPLWEIKQGDNICRAAKEARIHHLVFTSVCNADEHTKVPFYDSKHEIEKLIAKSGVPYTIVRPAFFFDNWLPGEFGQIKKNSVAGLTSANRRIQLVSACDIGRCVALAFSQPEIHLNTAINLASIEMTGTEIAAALSKLANRRLHWTQYPPSVVAYWFAPGVYRAIIWNEKVGFHADVNACRQLIPNMLTFEQWLQQQKDVFNF